MNVVSSCALLAFALSASIFQADACYFHNCPAAYDWNGKRTLPFEKFRRNDQQQQLSETYQGQGIEQCPARKNKPKKLCRFIGVEICCQFNSAARIICETSSTSNKASLEVAATAGKYEKMLQQYMERDDVIVMKDQKLCVRVGACCTKSQCDEELSCSTYQETSSDFDAADVDWFLKRLSLNTHY